MLRNYFTIALRNLQRNAVYSFINIFGLSVGIACSILILLWVHEEVSYNRFLPNAGRLYQVWINAHFENEINSWTSVPLPTYQALKNEDSRIKNVTMSDWGSLHLLSVDENTRFNKRGYYVGEEFLQMFPYKVIAGNINSALTEASSIVITESVGKSFFGDEDPMGKVIRVDDAYDLEVTAVLENIPENSSFQFEMLLPYKLYLRQDWVKESETNWGNYSFQVYAELQPGANHEEVEGKVKDLLARNGQTDIVREYFLYPMTRWRLYSNFINGVESGGLIDYVKLFIGIAIFVLAIACINFMNLATARSERRAREVGIRKSVGSRRSDLVVQFLGESIMISILAFLVAVVLVELTLPFYNDLLQKKLFLDYASPAFWGLAAVLILLTGVLAGSYPALFLSSFKPVKVLKSKVQIGNHGGTPRKVLVTLQFGFSIILIVGMAVIFKQIEHLKSRNLGYDQENLITINYTEEIGKNYPTIKQELLRTGAVESVTKSNSPITAIYSNNFIDWPGKPEDFKVMFATVATEFDYTKTMGIKVLEGRDFSEEFPSDSSAIIVNKAAMDMMNLEDPIGAQLEMWGSKRTLVGIVDNVIMDSPYREVPPTMYVFIPDWVSAITVRLGKTNDLQASLGKVEEVLRKYNPAYPFEYKFADVEFAKKFRIITLISTLATIFAVLAILITCLGLFGLASFTAEQRTKELGIRKVLGASVSSLIILVSRDFTKLVLIAFVISSPIAWWGVTSFLERYPMHISFPWWILPASGLLALILSLIIVGAQAMKAAITNPVQSLRNE